MLDSSDQPYEYYPPRRWAILAWLLGLYNCHYYLPRKMRVVGVEVSGHLESIRKRNRSDRLLFLPNHPTHYDAYIYFEALRRVGVSTHTMAAYDVFLRSRINAWIMQRMGVFSVDREGSDKRAMKQAMSTLAAGRHALTIFPEGNVYLQNDLVTPFHEGAAFIGLRSAAALAEEGYRVLAVPVSIKATYLTDVRPQLEVMLNDLAAAVQAEMPSEAPVRQKIHHIGRAGLIKNLHQRGHEVPETETLPELIQHAAGAIVERLEQKIDLKARPKDSLFDRIRRVRRVIHELRLDESRTHDHTVAVHWADEAMLAFRIASYSGKYLKGRITIDRFAETVEKLAEDTYARVIDPLSTRHAYIHFNEPIDLSEYLDSFKKKARGAIEQFTERCEKSVQEGIDQLNARNPHPGGRVWEEE